jgi:hypothetical protein
LGDKLALKAALASDIQEDRILIFGFQLPGYGHGGIDMPAGAAAA